MDTSWLFDVDFSPLIGRPVLITGERAYDLAVRLTVNDVPFRYVPTFTEAVAMVPPGADGSDRQLHRVPRHPSGAGPCSSDRVPPSQWSASAPARESALRIVSVYPDLMSTYGDRGNLLILTYRARQRGLAVEAGRGAPPTQPLPRYADIYLLGGGEDGPQSLAAQRLNADGALHRAVEQRRGGVRGLRRLPTPRQSCSLARGSAGKGARTAGHPPPPGSDPGGR